MKTIYHLTQQEIEDALVSHIATKLSLDLTIPLKAEIIVELESVHTGDPRDPPGTDVKCIRAEVKRET